MRITNDPLEMRLTFIGTKFLYFSRQFQYSIPILLPF